ncbi:MAG: methyltransferase domain-containing protein [Candidatus Magasanikbacteria bacterium]
MSYHSGNQLIDPALLFEKVHLHEGMHVADFGCGRTGHVVFPASLVVGVKGIVYAVDILKDVLENVRKRAMLEAIHNIETVWADLEKSGGIAIPHKTLDVGFFVNVLYHMNSYDTTLNEVASILRDKGRIVVVDWERRLSTIGPSEDSMVRFDDIASWTMNNNFVVQEDFKASPYHRGLVLFKAE